MRIRCAAGVLSAVALIGCSRAQWPDPPAIDQAKYQDEYKAWREERQETLLFAVRILGIWPLEHDETPFGSDSSLPIALPARSVPARAGVFRRTGTTIEVVPAPGALLKYDGVAMKGPSEVEEFNIGPVNVQLFSMGEGTAERRFVTASDDQHPALERLAAIETYPVDARWRVAARFDAFDSPQAVRIANVRGGYSESSAPGELVFRVNDQEQRLIALAEPGEKDFFVMFKDATNGSTTYGYRMLSPPAVRDGEWTVLDFNMASNPPCAYSPYTTCPLPPAKNRVQAAIEAGEKRHPTAKGFSAP